MQTSIFSMLSSTVFLSLLSLATSTLISTECNQARWPDRAQLQSTVNTQQQFSSIGGWISVEPGDRNCARPMCDAKTNSAVWICNTGSETVSLEYGYLGTMIGYIISSCATSAIGGIEGQAWDSDNYNVIVRSGDGACPSGQIIPIDGYGIP